MTKVKANPTQLTQDFLEAVKRWLVLKGVEAVAVTGWDEYISAGYGCPTCGPDYEVEVWINYTDTKDAVRSKTYRYDGQFGYLLTELLNA